MRMLKLYAPALVCFAMAIEIAVFGPGESAAFALRLVVLGVSLACHVHEKLRMRQERRDGA